MHLARSRSLYSPVLGWCVRSAVVIDSTPHHGRGKRRRAFVSRPAPMRDTTPRGSSAQRFARRIFQKSSGGSTAQWGADDALRLNGRDAVCTLAQAHQLANVLPLLFPRGVYVRAAHLLDACMLSPYSLMWNYAELGAAAFALFHPLGDQLVESVTGFSVDSLAPLTGWMKRVHNQVHMPRWLRRDDQVGCKLRVGVSLSSSSSSSLFRYLLFVLVFSFPFTVFGVVRVVDLCALCVCWSVFRRWRGKSSSSRPTTRTSLEV
jgi:hypothetical protein